MFHDYAGPSQTGGDLESGKVTTVPNSGGLWTVRWSPDGRHLAALAFGDMHLVLHDVETGAWRSVPAADHIETMSWSSDSAHVFYHTERMTPAQFRSVRIADGKVETVAVLDRYAMANHGWSGLAPDNSPIFLRRLGVPEIFALDIERRDRHPGTLALWHPGTLAPWHFGTLAPWHPGTLAPWHPGTLAPCHSGTLAL